MPPKHDHHKPAPHEKHGGPGGPKERELAVALTVAVLRAAKVEGSLDDVETAALRTYQRMLAGITKAEATNGALPPTVSF